MDASNMPMNSFCGRTRREFFWQAGGGFAGVALAGLLDGTFLSQQTKAADESPLANPLAPKEAHFDGPAKSVIFLFMYGGPSHIDTYDYKPNMYGMDGQMVPITTFGRGGKKNVGRVVEPRWKFKQYGQCGKWVSDLFPHTATCVDDIAFIHSMYAESPIHGSAMLMMNSGRLLSGHPCLGSWVNYGLGSVNENLPGFVVMLDPTGGPISGAKNWSSGYMPAYYQGTLLQPKGDPILDLAPPADMPPAAQRRMLDSLARANQRHMDSGRISNSNLAARVASFELAYKMQQHAPEAVDLADEPEHIRRMYGLDEPRTSDFARKCILARRLVERGVRFIQIYSGGSHNDANWDAHGDLVQNHNFHAGNTDLPIAGLLKDLKQRGLLQQTLVVWGGEFGRQPTAEYAEGTGRDHNAFGFTMWMAGGGIKGGMAYGETDEWGYKAVTHPLMMHDLHATILHVLGLDHERLTYRFSGRDMRLTDVHGNVVRDILA